MTAISDSTKVNGKKYFAYRRGARWMGDPFKPQDMWTRTFVPKGLDVLQDDTLIGMIDKIKKDTKAKFDPSQLSDETLIMFVDEGLTDKLEDAQGEDEQ